jgi:hypothetical protein
MTKRIIPGLNSPQSDQARALLGQISTETALIASSSEPARRRALKYLINRIKVHLDGVSAPKKARLSRLLRERQEHRCPVCGEPLPNDPDAVEKHRLNRNGGYDDPRTIELRHRHCHRSEHAASDWS